MNLVWPELAMLPSYTEALRRGWSPNNARVEVARIEELAAIEADQEGFIALQVDRDAKGLAITLSNGTTVARLPGFRMWMWDGEFCGMIGLRWQKGTAELPPTCLGHIGYTVVEWKRGRGYATRALRLLLPQARAEGLPFVELTTNPDNIPSQKVILANGGALVERFEKPDSQGGGECFKYRIELGETPARPAT